MISGCLSTQFAREGLRLAAPAHRGIDSDNAEDFKLGGRGHTTSPQRQSLGPRPVSLKVNWAIPGRFGGTIALCVLNETDLFSDGYGFDGFTNTASPCGPVTS